MTAAAGRTGGILTAAALALSALAGTPGLHLPGPTALAAAAAPPHLIHIDVVTLVDAVTNDVATHIFGVADSDLYNLSPSQLVAELTEIHNLGVTDLRLGVPWLYIQPTATTYDWARMDDVINTAHAMGFTITADINGNPAWDGPLISGAPDPTAYAAFAAEVAERYGSAISSYEIWNEPNGVIFYSPVSAATYTTLLQDAYTAIKGVAPDATVIAGSLGATTTINGLSLSPDEFLQQMYAHGAQGYFDALSYHPYHYTLPFSAGGGVTDSPLQQVEELNAIMAANGDGDLKIWATEYGNPTTPVIGVSQTVQANFLEDFLVAWSKLPFAGPAFVYTAQDLATGALNHEGNFGLFTDDGSAKDAAQMLATLIGDNANGTLPDYTAPLLPDAEAAYVQLMSMIFGLFNQAMIIPNAIIAAIYNELPAPLQQAFTAMTDFVTGITTQLLEASKPFIEDTLAVLLGLGL